MNTSSNQLLKLLGIGFGIAVTLGGTIGAGILRKPGPIAASLGDPWLIMSAWLLVSLYAFAGVLCTIELSTALPKAGSWYVYARRAYGDYFGFVTGLCSWLGTVAALAFGSYTFSEYLLLFFPHHDALTPWIAALTLVSLALLHWTGTKNGGQSQILMSMLKALGLLIFIAFCFLMPAPLSAPLSVETINHPGLVAGYITALLAIFYTFDGWHTASYFAEENTDPAKTLPRSMISGVLSIIAIYFLINLALLHVLPLSVLAQSKMAAGDAMALLFGEKSGNWIKILLILIILGLVNTQMMFAPRVIYSMGRDGLLFKALEKVNPKGTPTMALFITALSSLSLILSSKEVCSRLAEIATFFFILSYMSGFASLMKLRKKEPELIRPFKTPAYPYLPLALLLFSAFFLAQAVWQDPASSRLAIIFLILSYPLYKLQQFKKKALQKAKDKLSLLPP